MSPENSNGTPETEEVVVQSKNPSRIRRLKAAMDELNYLDRVINDLFKPLQDRKQKVVARIQEALIDEGIPGGFLSIKADDETNTVTYTVPKRPKKKATKKKPVRR